MQELQVLSLGWEDPLESEMATRFSILPWKIFHGQRSLVGYSHGVAKSHIQLSTEEKNYKRWDGPRTGWPLGLP